MQRKSQYIPSNEQSCEWQKRSVQSMCQSKATSLPAKYEWRPHMHRIIKPQANLNGSADTPS
jgi:hypothetical protein